MGPRFILFWEAGSDRFYFLGKEPFNWWIKCSVVHYSTVEQRRGRGRGTDGAAGRRRWWEQKRRWRRESARKKWWLGGRKKKKEGKMKTGRESLQYRKWQRQIVLQEHELLHWNVELQTASRQERPDFCFMHTKEKWNTYQISDSPHKTYRGNRAANSL